MKIEKNLGNKLKYEITKRRSADKIRAEKDFAETDDVTAALSEPSLKKKFENVLQEHNELIQERGTDREEEEAEDYPTAKSREKAIEDMLDRIYFWKTGENRPRDKNKGPRIDGSGLGNRRGAKLLGMSDENFEELDNNTD